MLTIFSHLSYLPLVCVCVSVWECACVCICVSESPSSLKMMFRNDTFPHDSVAFSGTANQGSGAGTSCRDAARRQAATPVCRLISPPYCHFVKSHYPNENGSGKAVTEQGYGWAMCQRHSDFIPSTRFLNSKSWAGGWGWGGVVCSQKVVGSFHPGMCHCQGCFCCSVCFLIILFVYFGAWFK